MATPACVVGAAVDLLNEAAGRRRPSRARSGRRGRVPTAAELQIVIEAEDRASAQLRQVGQAVAAPRAPGGGRAAPGRRGGGLLGGLHGRGDRGGAAGLRAMGGVIGFIRTSVVTLNSELERNVATFEAMTGSAEAAGDVVAALRREAAASAPSPTGRCWPPGAP